MDARMLDVTTGVTSLAVFMVALMILPILPVPGGKGVAYILAIVIYVALMSGTGFLVRGKIA